MTSGSKVEFLGFVPYLYSYDTFLTLLVRPVALRELTLVPSLG